MLSVIIDADGREDRVAGLLAALTEASVEGIVREVLIVGVRTPALLEALCAETGAVPAADLPDAAERARAEWLLVLPAKIRFRDGWVERLKDHLTAGGGPAVLRGLRPDSLFAVRPFGVLVPKGTSVRAGLHGLRQQGADRVRLD